MSRDWSRVLTRVGFRCMNICLHQRGFGLDLTWTDSEVRCKLTNWQTSYRDSNCPVRAYYHAQPTCQALGVSKQSAWCWESTHDKSMQTKFVFSIQYHYVSHIYTQTETFNFIQVLKRVQFSVFPFLFLVFLLRATNIKYHYPKYNLLN